MLHPQVRLSHPVVIQHLVAFSFQCDLPILWGISSLTQFKTAFHLLGYKENGQPWVSQDLQHIKDIGGVKWREAFRRLIKHH